MIKMTRKQTQLRQICPPLTRNRALFIIAHGILCMSSSVPSSSSSVIHTVVQAQQVTPVPQRQQPPASNSATPAPPPPPPILYQRPIDADGTLIGTLQIRQGEEPADVVYQFCQEHQVSSTEMRESLLTNVCQTLPCQRRKALLFTTRVVDEHQKELGIFELFDEDDGVHVEPVDAAHDFVTRLGLDKNYRHGILVATCKVVPCTRLEPGKLCYS
jgi:hypothetical protein